MKYFGLIKRSMSFVLVAPVSRGMDVVDLPVNDPLHPLQKSY